MTRRTVARPVALRGIGLHGGGACLARVAPAVSGAGLRLNGAPVDTLEVVDARFATTLATPRGPVATVEHLLAALRIAGVDDAEVEVEGGEAPLLDGSAAPWLEAVTPVDHPGEREVWVLDAPVEVREGEALVRAEPAREASVAVDVAFAGLGRRRFAAAEPDWAAALAPARTFGFLRDEAALRAAGRIAGVSLANTVVFDDAGRPLNPEGLRFADEPARHKALDLVGDLALLGAPLCAHVTAVRAGHRLHHALVAAVRRHGRRLTWRATSTPTERS